MLQCYTIKRVNWPSFHQPYFSSLPRLSEYVLQSGTNVARRNYKKVTSCCSSRLHMFILLLLLLLPFMLLQLLYVITHWLLYSETFVSSLPTDVRVCCWTIGWAVTTVQLTFYTKCQYQLPMTATEKHKHVPTTSTWWMYCDLTEPALHRATIATSQLMWRRLSSLRHLVVHMYTEHEKLGVNEL